LIRLQGSCIDTLRIKLCNNMFHTIIICAFIFLPALGLVARFDVPAKWHYDKPMNLQLGQFPPPSDRDLLQAVATADLHDTGCNRTSVSVQHRRRAESACKHLNDTIEEQLDAVLTNEVLRDARRLHGRPLVWTVIDKAYASAAHDFSAQLRAANLHHQLFVSIDSEPDVAHELCIRGLPTVNFQPAFEHEFSSKGTPVKWTTKYRVAKSKFTMPALLQKRGVGNIFSEGDIFWLQDPMPVFASTGGDVVIGTHASNPNSINIGAWYIPANASANVTLPFTHSWNAMRDHQSEETAEDPMTLFDQDVLTLFLHDRGATQRCNDHATGDWGALSRMCDSFRDQHTPELDVRKLSNAVFRSTHYGGNDDDTIAVHILDGAPLSSVSNKFQRAKLEMVFVGEPTYYETELSQTRYLGWDGLLFSTSKDFEYDKYPIYNSKPNRAVEGALKMVFALSLVTGRAAILPKLEDVIEGTWPVEELFDVPTFQKDVEHDGSHFEVRESNFLYNDRLNVEHMYPVARVRLEYSNGEPWAGVSFVSHKGAIPKLSYSKLASEDLQERTTSVFLGMLRRREVLDAKTVLIKFTPGGFYKKDSFDWLGENCPSSETMQGASRLFCDTGDTSGIHRAICQRCYPGWADTPGAPAHPDCWRE